jgi:hypothetical protein
MTSIPDRRRWLPRVDVRKLVFELVVVFIGVWAALWTDNRRERLERKDRALRIADAMAAEITHMNGWFRPWRDSVADNYEYWRSRVERGERPPPYYFRVPGTEGAPSVAWQGALSSGLLEVFDPRLVFEIGVMYNEWAGIGERLARYHASTESLIFPVLGGPLRDSIDRPGHHSPRRWRETVASRTTPPLYDAAGKLMPAFLGNLVLMEEILAEMDHKYAWSLRLKTQVDSAVASLRSGK